MVGTEKPKKHEKSDFEGRLMHAHPGRKIPLILSKFQIFGEKWENQAISRVKAGITLANMS